MKIKQVVFETDNKCQVTVSRSKKNELHFEVTRGMSTLDFVIDTKSIATMGKTARKYVSISDGDIIVSLLVEFLRTGKLRKFKSGREIAGDSDFVKITCRGGNFEFFGSVIETIESIEM